MEKRKTEYVVSQEGMADIILERNNSRENEYKSRILKMFIECRKKQKLTQQNLADVSGIARANIARFENGSYNPTLDTMIRLATAMGKRLEINLVDKD